LATVPTAQHFVLDRLARPLRARGVDIVLKGSSDWTVADRKCAGSAQRRLKSAILVHASVLYAANIDLVERYLQLPARQPEYRAGRSHAEFLTNLKLSREELAAAFRDAWHPSEDWGDHLAIEPTIVDQLVASKYSLATWVERF
jgi:lipoate-protein ligase A